MPCRGECSILNAPNLIKICWIKDAEYSGYRILSMLDTENTGYTGYRTLKCAGYKKIRRLDILLHTGCAGYK